MAEHRVARSVVVAAPAPRIFSILAAPSRHSEIDASGSVRGVRFGPERLGLGERFAMDMRIVAPYRMSNRVVEFEEGRRIAWRHQGPHRWRWELEELDDGTTRVTETFDYSYASRLARAFYVLAGWPSRNARSIEATLLRLKDAAEREPPAPFGA